MPDTNILVVDDDEMMVLFLSEYLGTMYNVAAHPNAETAKEWLSAGNNPQLIIMDLSMPDMDGFAFLSWLKDQEKQALIPVIVLSGSEKSTDRVSCLRMGAVDFIQNRLILRS